MAIDSHQESPTSKQLSRRDRIPLLDSKETGQCEGKFMVANYFAHMPHMEKYLKLRKRKSKQTKTCAHLV